MPNPDEGEPMEVDKQPGPEDRRREAFVLGGFPACWCQLNLDVRFETDGESGPVVASAVELYLLLDPEKSVDSAALLRERVIPDPPYWALPWTGARALAAITAGMTLAADSAVLDLGCGLGLAGLPLALRGHAVTFGDYLDEPLEFVRATLDRLEVTTSVVRRIDFTSANDDGSRFDLILAADIVYDPAHYAPLANHLNAHLADGGTIVLTESLRADATVFLDGMKKRGFADQKHALWVEEDGRRERTWLHTLTRRVA